VLIANDDCVERLLLGGRGHRDEWPRTRPSGAIRRITRKKPDSNQNQEHVKGPVTRSYCAHSVTFSKSTTGDYLR
jgi:hypothetical protein